MKNIEVPFIQSSEIEEAKVSGRFSDKTMNGVMELTRQGPELLLNKDFASLHQLATVPRVADQARRQAVISKAQRSTPDLGDPIKPMLVRMLGLIYGGGQAKQLMGLDPYDLIESGFSLYEAPMYETMTASAAKLAGNIVANTILPGLDRRIGDSNHVVIDTNAGMGSLLFGLASNGLNLTTAIDRNIQILEATQCLASKARLQDIDFIHSGAREYVEEHLHLLDNAARDERPIVVIVADPPWQDYKSNGNTAFGAGLFGESNARQILSTLIPRADLVALKVPRFINLEEFIGLMPDKVRITLHEIEICLPLRRIPEGILLIERVFADNESPDVNISNKVHSVNLINQTC